MLRAARTQRDQLPHFHARPRDATLQFETFGAFIQRQPAFQDLRLRYASIAGIDRLGVLEHMDAFHIAPASQCSQFSTLLMRGWVAGRKSLRVMVVSYRQHTLPGALTKENKIRRARNSPFQNPFRDRVPGSI